VTTPELATVEYASSPVSQSGRPERLTLGLDSIDSIALLGQQLNVGNVLNLLPVNNPPMGSADEPGFLSLRVGAALVTVNVTLRYLTGSHFDIGKVRMVSGRAKQECF
jgi:hypothetical protein